MIPPPLFIKNIRQCDNNRFVIDWSDNLSQTYRLSNLQKNCPCARCFDAETGHSKLPPSTIDDNVRATQLSSVGRYALRVVFTSGCSAGIYSYQLLRTLAEETL